MYDRQVRDVERQKSANVEKFNKAGNTVLFSLEVLNKLNLHLIPFSFNGKIGFINKMAEVVVEPKYDKIRGSFREATNYVAVQKDNKWTVINSKGVELLKPENHIIFPGYDCPLAVIQNQSKSKVVNVETDEVIVDSQYDYIDGFRYGYARVRVGNNNTGKWGIINEAGKLILPTEYAAVYPFYNFPRATTVLKLTDESPEQFILLAEIEEIFKDQSVHLD